MKVAVIYETRTGNAERAAEMMVADRREFGNGVGTLTGIWGKASNVAAVDAIEGVGVAG